MRAPFASRRSELGFTERQARFLVTVMAHSGSFLERQYCTFTGSARGQNSRAFVGRLVDREELTLVRIYRHSGQLEELDVEGILAFAERVLPRAADLWVQASLEQRQRFQQLFFPDGIAFDGKGFVGTRVTAPAFSYLRQTNAGNERMVDLTGIEPVTS